MFIYHIKSNSFRGAKIYSLNKLRSIHPQEYKRQIEKYSYRKDLMDAYLPVVDCLWNDVIHLSPIDIGKAFQIVLDTYESCGLDTTDIRKRYDGRAYFKIDTKELDLENIFIFLNRNRAKYKYDFKAVEEQFMTFEKGKNCLYGKVPERHIEYLKQCANKRDYSPLLFKFIPHILYKDDIDIRRAEEILYKI